MFRLLLCGLLYLKAKYISMLYVLLKRQPYEAKLLSHQCYMQYSIQCLPTKLNDNIKTFCSLEDFRLFLFLNGYGYTYKALNILKSYARHVFQSIALFAIKSYIFKITLYLEKRKHVHCLNPYIYIYIYTSILQQLLNCYYMISFKVVSSTASCTNTVSRLKVNSWKYLIQLRL